MRPDEAREIVSAQRAAPSGLLSVARVTIAGAVSRALADVRTSLRVAVPAHSLFVIDAAIRVQPDTVSRGQCACAAASVAKSSSEPPFTGAVVTSGMMRLQCPDCTYETDNYSKDSKTECPVSPRVLHGNELCLIVESSAIDRNLICFKPK